MEDVRRMLLAPEHERIAVLETRPAIDKATVGDVLPEALAHASRGRLDSLSIAFGPPTKQALSEIVAKEPEMFGEILAPSIGAAVKKAVADLIAAMEQRFNLALENSLSGESLRWRMEARRTGRPFAEVVLVHTLLYRVEQVFLIHTETGLLLQHVTDEAAGRNAPDRVASMLSAIDAFVRDSFGPLTPGAHLRRIQVGDVTIWIEHDVRVTLAAVVRGVAPARFGEMLCDAGRRVRVGFGDHLERFTYDVTPFEGARPDLERLIHEVRRPPRARARVVATAAALAAATAIAAGIVTYQLSALRAERTRLAYLSALEAEPGILVTSIDAKKGRFRIAGLADPVAPRPSEVLRRHGLRPADLRFAPMYSLDPRLAVRRLERALSPPPTVRLSLGRDGTLRATGTAPRAWIERARAIAPALALTSRFEDSLRAADEDIEAAQAAASSLESIEVRFGRGAAEPLGDDLAAVARRAHELATLAARAGVAPCIALTGYADATGTARENARLSRARALAVAAALDRTGLPHDRIRARGAGLRTGVRGPRARAVLVDVELAPANARCGDPP